MVAARCLCAPRVCGVLVACAGMARCMLSFAFAVCACFVVPVPVLYCGTHVSTHVTCRPVDDCHVRHGRVARLLAYGWAGNGTSRGCGEGTGDQQGRHAQPGPEIGFTA